MTNEYGMVKFTCVYRVCFQYFVFIVILKFGNLKYNLYICTLIYNNICHHTNLYIPKMLPH